MMLFVLLLLPLIQCVPDETAVPLIGQKSRYGIREAMLLREIRNARRYTMEMAEAINVAHREYFIGILEAGIYYLNPWLASGVSAIFLQKDEPLNDRYVCLRVKSEDGPTVPFTFDEFVDQRYLFEPNAK